VPGEPLGPPVISSFVPELSLVFVGWLVEDAGFSKSYFHPLATESQWILFLNPLKDSPAPFQAVYSL